MTGFENLGMERRALSSLIVLLACGALSCSEASAAQLLAPIIPRPPLPVASANWLGSGSATKTYTPNQLRIDQTSQKAKLFWDSFNIASGNTVTFNQPNESAVALNIINDLDPSVIQGALNANGQVYLINRNGILFDKGAQINVHTLVASTLDITDDAWNKGIGAITDGSPVFASGAVPDGLVRVEAGAQLNAATGGKIMLFAPNVENNGVITTPDGQTILAAGSKVYLASIGGSNTDKVENGSPLANNLRGLLVEVDSGGSASNLGKIVAERGNVTLVGLAVNQEGRISATTSVNSNGSIRLLARDTTRAVSKAGDGSGIKTVTATRTGTVLLKSGSVTEVLPDLADKTTSPDEQQFNPSLVEVVGGLVKMQANSHIVVPGGQVILSALENPQLMTPFKSIVSASGAPKNSSRVYLESGSSIDVAGTQNVEVPIERNVVDVDLYGDVLKDSPLQNRGVLRGETISVDIRKGTPLGDYSGYEAKIGRTVAERTAAGGTVKLISEGDIVVRQDATVNLSGGSLKYLDGYLNTTKLVSQGRIYDISEATPDRVYEGIAGIITRDHAKWGVTESWVSTLGSRGQFTQGYVEGKNAGTLQFIAPSIVMDGTVIGKTLAGIYQRQPYSADLAGAPYKTLHTLLPKGATLTVGDDAHATKEELDVAIQDFKTPSVSFVSQATALPEGFDANTALPMERANQVQLATGLMGKDAVANLAVYSNGKIGLASGLTLEAPGGSVKLVGGEVNVAGNIDVQSGSITLQSLTNTVSVSGTLNASGGWVNDNAAMRAGGSATDPLRTKGGSIVIQSFMDTLLLPGSTLDVSGGGWVDAKGKLAGKSDAGSIDIASGERQPKMDRNATTLTLGNLYGYALGKGGSLSLKTGKVQIGESGQPDELVLPASFFSQGGFSKYTVTGTDGLNIADGPAIQAKAESRVIDPEYRLVPTGRGMAAASHRELLPDALRKPISLTFSASSQLYGNLDMQKGAAIAVDAGGSIKLEAGRQMTVDGTLNAPAGTIGLAMNGTAPGTTDDYNYYGFLSNQSIWLGKNAQLLSRGFDNALVKDNGLRQGEILDGGQVTINAQKGYVVTEAGSLIDVSGTSGSVDVLRGAGGKSTYQRTEVASNAGAIKIEASEGALLDGGMIGKAGGAGAQGGAFSLKVDRGDAYDPSVVPTKVTPYPGADRQVVVSQQSGFVPAGLKAGDAIDAESLNGKGKVAADDLMNGGFAQIKLQAKDAVSFDGDVTLQSARSIQLDAPTIVAASGKTVNLNSGYVGIANSNPKYQVLPKVQGGTAKLNVAAQWIDLEGKVALNGFGQTVLASTGDIRLKGIWNQDIANLAMTGSFATAGDLEMRARQIYPSTLSEYTIAITGNPSGTLHVAANGSDTPVLSAGGKLTLSAPNILQDGTIKAPLGEITLAAENSLTLGSASLTSVSAEGQIIPFGTTSNGKEWQYALGGTANLTITTPPEKRVTLDGNDISIKNGAKVDLSGGGDLYAYEFIPGPPGRSVDILSASDSYAVMPGLQSAFAPYDPQYASGSALKPGDSVYLSGANGLPAGVYTLLPARYALLPGALLVQSVSGYRDMQPQQKLLMADGTQIVAGYRTVTDQRNDAARFSGFAVRPGADIKKEAEYQQSYASQFFAQQAQVKGSAVPRLPMDAGQLVLAPRENLVLQGDPFKAGHDGGRGAIMDVDVNKLYVGNGNAAPDGYVSIDAGMLTRLNAESILLGGTRKTTIDGLEISVGSDHVVVANSATNPLKASEIILAAKDTITLKVGSSIDAQGAAGDAGLYTAAGNGALVRAASSTASFARSGSPDGASGTLIGEAGSTIKASSSIALDATRQNDFQGATIFADGKGNAVAGNLAMGATRVSFGDAPADSEGLVFSQTRLDGLNSLESLALTSYSTFDLYGDVSVGGINEKGKPTLQSLTLRGAGLAGIDNSGKTANLRATELLIDNSANSMYAAVGAMGDGTLEIQADRLVLGKGDKAIKGYSQVNVTANELIGRGTGKTTIEADTNLNVARISGEKGSNQALDASGKLNAAKTTADRVLAAVNALGAKWALAGTEVLFNTKATLPSGQFKLTATTGNLELGANAEVDVAGRTVQFIDVSRPSWGGTAEFVSDTGNVMVATGANVDVSAAPGGDAGSVIVRAVEGTAIVAGNTLQGSAAGVGGERGEGARFDLDVKELADFSALNTTLNQGGFDGARSVRVRTGNVSVAASDTLKAKEVRIAVDGGKLDVAGHIDASGKDAGSIGLFAKNNVTVLEGAKLDAYATGEHENGGEVEIGTVDGRLNLAAGSSIDVHAGSGGEGGEVLLRAPRTGGGAGTDVAVDGVNSSISGAKSVVVEAVKLYEGKTTLTDTGASSGTTLSLATVNTDNTSFATKAGTIKSRLGKANDANFHVRAGVEVRATGDLTLSKDWKLGASRAGGEPGVLTLRAEGNLNLNSNLSDGFNVATASSGATPATLLAGDSWGYRLIAGADKNAANPMTVKFLDLLGAGKGTVTVAKDKIVRTGTGDIAVAAGRDIVLKNEGSVIYTAGEKADSLGKDEYGAEIFSGNYARNGGNIKLLAQNDIQGTASNQLITEWLHRLGKTDIDNVDGTYKTSWSIRYDQFKQGVGALGGGDVEITAGRNVSNLDAVAPTTGRAGVIPKAVLKTEVIAYPGEDGEVLTTTKVTRTVLAGEAPTVVPLTVLGGGDVSVRAGGDILGGVFYVARGAGKVAAQGSIDSGRTVKSGDDSLPVHTVLALADGRFDVTALNDLKLETVVNPTMLALGKSQAKDPLSFFLTYAPDSKVNLMSLSGDVTLSNDIGTLKKALPNLAFSKLAGNFDALAVYPGNLSASALQGSIVVSNEFALSPSPTGNLNLLAARDIAIKGDISLSDADPALLPNVLNPSNYYVNAKNGAHASTPVHSGDNTPVRLFALNGDLAAKNGAVLYLAKPARIEAGRDIVDLSLYGQNLAAGDVTSIKAGRDITYADHYDAGILQNNSRTIQLDGPGRLELSAGRNVDLGNSVGVVTKGNMINPALPDQGADIAVTVGVKGAPDYAGFATQYGLDGASGYTPALSQAFFKQLMLAGTEHNAGKDGSVDSTGRTMGYQRGYDAIAALFPGSDYQGDLNLFISQIKTFRGGNIDLFVPGGKINAGLASVPQKLIDSKNASDTEPLASMLGVVTMKGGSVRSVSKGDFLVNSSRVFTLQGGDIVLWSSEGDIDAGKGAKTALAVPPPIITTKSDGTTTVEYQGAATGSGIRVLLTGDAVAGEVDLIAPKGAVNAGDAGIGSAGNINIAAQVVRGADNIQFSGSSSGVPVASTGSLAAGLTGVSGTAADAGKAGADAAHGLAQQKPQENFKSSFLNVEVIGFGE